jgi:NIPSNAP
MGIEVVELRQYTLHPGRRDELILLFDRELVEPQEACGMRVIGQFRDLDRPDRFVWFRGFPDMEARRRSLEGFYGGPVWERHAGAANATMIDSDDVLLLRPRSPWSPPTGRPLATGPSRGPLTITVLPAAAAETADPSAVVELASLHAPNTFPGLPVREGADVVVRVHRDAVAHPHAEQVIRAEATSRSALR